MVLESIISPQEAEKNPLDMFLLGIIVSTIGLWLAYYIFPSSTSTWGIFLTALALLPLLHHILAHEEAEDMAEIGKHIWERHGDVIADYLFMFAGMTVSFLGWYKFLPATKQAIFFKSQITMLGLQIDPATILLTNIKILVVFIALAVVFGAGAVLLLAWDASITAVLIGNMFVAGGNISASLPMFGFKILEALGFSAAAIAGGILSVALVRKHYKSKKFHFVLLDVTTLFSLAVLVIVAAALLKAYVIYY